MHDQAAETFGLYSDGTSLVIDLQNYQFPQKCLVSGERVESEQVPLSFYAWTVPPKSSESFGKGVIKSTWWLGPIQVVSLVVRAATGSATGLSDSSLTKHSKLLGVYLLVLGTLMAIAGTILTFIGCIAWQWPWAFIPVNFVVGSMISVSGIIILVRKNWPLRIRKVDSGFAWLVGVNPTLLVPLPSWKKSLAYKDYRRRIGYQRLAIGGMAFLVGAIPIVTGYQDLVDAVSSRQWVVTQGAISSSKITSERIETGKNTPVRTVYVVDVQYTFRVAGAVYTGNRIRFGPPASHHNRRYASEVLERQYPVGKPVEVFYHPQEPSRSTLRIASWDEVWQQIRFSLLVFAVAAWGLISGGLKLLRAA